MNKGKPDPWEAYLRLAPSWREARADPLGNVEAILEMLVALRMDEAFVGSRDEVTLKEWTSLCRRLAKGLPFTGFGDHTADGYARVPGLLEQTRRALKPWATHAHVASTLLGHFVYGLQAGLRGSTLGHLKLPAYLTGLFEGILGRRSQDTIYCPFDSSGWLPLLLAADGFVVRSEVENAQTARVMRLFAILGRWNLDVRESDPIRNPAWLEHGQLKTFDQAVGIATFGMRQKDNLTADRYGRFPIRCHYGESIQLAHLVAQSHGRVVLVVPEGFLFRTSGGERNYKEYLGRRGWLHAVISLPRGAFAPASIHTSMLVLDKSKPVSRDVLFVDGTSDLKPEPTSEVSRGTERDGAAQVVAMLRARKKGPTVAAVSIDTIASNDFNLSVDRYVRGEDENAALRLLDHANTAELGDIAEVIRPQVIPTDDLNPGAELAEVGLSEINQDGIVGVPAKSVRVSEKGLVQARRQQLEFGDVLLSVKGRIGAVGIVMERAPEWVPSQAFVIVRLRKTSPITSSTVLYRYLASPFVQGLLRSLSSGTTVPSLQMGDIRKLRVIVPTAEEEREIERQHDKLLKLRKQISELEKLAAELSNAAWPATKVTTNKTDEKVR